MKRTLLGLLLATTFSANAGPAWVLNLNKGSGKVEFNAVGKPKMLKIHGVGKQAKGMLSVEGGKVSGQATFDLASLDTGIEMRNTHMKEKYLETGKFPNATLEIVQINLPNPIPKGDFSHDAKFTGKLTLHGVSKAVKGTAKLKKEGNMLTGIVDFDTTVKAFNIDLPSFAGITMADEVAVHVEFSGPMTPKGATQNIAGN